MVFWKAGLLCSTYDVGKFPAPGGVSHILESLVLVEKMPAGKVEILLVPRPLEHVARMQQERRVGGLGFCRATARHSCVML